MYERVDDNKVASGAWGTVEYAIELSGSMPARKFYESLETGDKAKFSALFQHMADGGKIYDKRKFNHLRRTPIYEFKRSLIRILCFQDGNSWCLTNGFSGKRGQGKCPPSQLERAQRIMKEHFERKNKGKRKVEL